MPEIAAMDTSNLMTVLRHFSVCFCYFDVFRDDDSQILLFTCCQKLLNGHVIVCLHVVVSDVLHGTFINIEFICHLCQVPLCHPGL